MSITDEGSMLSLSGIEQLDQQLNAVKTKALEILRQILNYAFNQLD